MELIDLVKKSSRKFLSRLVRRLQRPCSCAQGATLVETALMFPLLLAVIFIFITMGILYNARQSLDSAVATTRLAYTRGQTQLVGTDVIQDVQTWQGTGGWSFGPASSDLKDLLASSDEQSAAFASTATAPGYSYNQGANNTFGVHFKELPTHYIYAVIYAVQSMNQSVGALKFPCDPNHVDGSGCLMCELLHPATGTTTGDGTTPFDPGYNLNWVGIQCSYRPASIFIDPIYAMLRFLTGSTGAAQIVMTRAQHFP